MLMQDASCMCKSRKGPADLLENNTFHSASHPNKIYSLFISDYFGLKEDIPSHI